MYIQREGKRRWFTALLLAVAILFLFGASTLADEPAAEPVADEAELQAALNGSEPTIALAGNIELTKALTLKRSVTIEGGGYTLTLASGVSARHIVITGGSSAAGKIVVQLNQLVVAGHGNAAGGGIAVANYTDLQLNGTVVKDNRAGSGGGISLGSYGQVTLGTGTKIIGNEADFTTGGTTTYGGGIYGYNNAYAVLQSGSEVSGNRASVGGGINVSRLLMEPGSAVKNNVASNNGGGLFVGGNQPAGSHAAIIQGEVSGNVCYYIGGGIYAGRGGLKLDGATVAGNKALGKVNSQPGGSVTYSSGGGGVRVAAGEVVVNNSTITGNSACPEKDTDYPVSEYYVGAQYGGGMWVGSSGDASTISITGSTISNNSAKQGGGLYLAGNTTITSTSITNNQAIKSDTVVSSGNGGGMVIDAGQLNTNTLHLVGGSFSNNTGHSGGAIYNGSANEDKTFVDGTAFSGNVALAGSIYWDEQNPVYNHAYGPEPYNQGQIRRADYYAANVSNVPSISQDSTNPFTFTNLYNNADINTSILYGVHFFPMGGKWQTKTGTGSASYLSALFGNEKVVLPDSATLDGYELEGWYCQYDENTDTYYNKWDFDKLLTGGMALYAKWVEKKPVTPPVNPPVNPPVEPPVNPPVEPPAPEPVVPTPPVVAPRPTITPPAAEPAPEEPVSKSTATARRSTGTPATTQQQPPAEQGGQSEPGLLMIGNSDTPLFGLKGSHWALANLIFAVAGLILGAIVITLGLLRRGEGSEGERTHTPAQFAWRIAAAALGLTGVLVFLATQDLSLKMALFDRWSALMAVLLAGQVVLMAVRPLAPKKDKRQPDAYEADPALLPGDSPA